MRRGQRVVDAVGFEVFMNLFLGDDGFYFVPNTFDALREIYFVAYLLAARKVLKFFVANVPADKIGVEVLEPVRHGSNRGVYRYRIAKFRHTVVVL